MEPNTQSYEIIHKMAKIMPSFDLMDEVINERERQLESHDKSAEDRMTDGQLLLATLIHVSESGVSSGGKNRESFIEFSDQLRAMYPTCGSIHDLPEIDDQRELLIRACALLLAEIERIDRKPS